MSLKLLLTTLAFSVAQSVHAALSIAGADGSDGVFPRPSSSTNIVVDLGLAVPAAWNANNSANAGNGVYDVTRWAIVYKYSSVNVPKGTRVSFKNHPSHAPVVWLVSGNVTIDGTVDLDASVGTGLFHEPGPGGFRGGAQALSGVLPAGSGMGPGGSSVDGVYGPSGNADPALVYGNARILPLIGGSGGVGFAGAGDPRNVRGGAGGGAILIVCQNSISINGMIIARSTQADGNVVHHSGSGGAIRLIADDLSGSGKIDALGLNAFGGSGGDGRVRLEALNYAGGLNVAPPTIRVLPDSPPIIFPDNLPTARILSVAGQPSPADPSSNLTDSGSDIVIQNDKPLEIQIETTNLRTNSTVIAHIIPRHGGRFTAPAKWLSGDASSSRWLAVTTVPAGFAAIQVRAVEQ
jgi:hypothetical protein